MSTYNVVIKDQFDPAWHQRFAEEHHIAWDDYLAALNRSPHMTLEQLEGAAGIMGMIANTIAQLAHRNLALERELSTIRQTAGRRSREKQEMVRQAIAFMQENLEKPVTVADAAHAVALSVPYFCTIFVEQVGQNPGDYLIDLRLECAKNYLTHTSMSVMEVCVALGYSPSYFTRLFKQRVGQTPGSYAQAMRKMSPDMPNSMLDE